MGVEQSDWLPADWKVEVKIRNCGRRDKYYINPSTGYKYNSRLEVLRYLKSSAKCQLPTESNQEEMNVSMKNTLPPGWIKGVRTRKKNRRTRKDPYYTDPVSGRCFRSIPEVLRHLKAKQQKDEGQMSANKKRHKNLAGILKSGRKLAGAARGSEKEIMDDGEDSTLLPVEAEKSVKFRKHKIDDSAILDHRLRSGSKTANFLVNLPQKLPQGGRRRSMRSRVNQSVHSEGSCPVGEGGELGNLRRIKKKRECFTSVTPRRSSKRLALLKVDQEKSSIEAIEDELETHGVSGRNRGEEEVECVEDKDGVKDNPEEGERYENEEAPDSLKNLLMDPCIEFAVKTLTGTIPIEDVQRAGTVSSPVSSMASPSRTTVPPPCGDIWADPCFEFAVKTLTGEIPIKLQVSFQQPRMGCKSLDNACTSSSSHSIGQRSVLDHLLPRSR